MTDTAHRIGAEWDTLTAQQRRRLAALDEELGTRRPVLDDELRTVALRAAVRWWRGELSLEDAGVALAVARREEARARAVSRALGVLAIEAGEQQSGTAAAVGVDRQALLKWAGLKD